MMELAEGQMARTLGREVISTRQRKIAVLAQREPKLSPDRVEVITDAPAIMGIAAWE